MIVFFIIMGLFFLSSLGSGATTNSQSQIDDYAGMLRFTVNSTGKEYVAIYSKNEYTHDSAWDLIKDWNDGETLPYILIMSASSSKED